LNDHHAAELDRIFARYAVLKPHCQWCYIPLDKFVKQLQTLGSITVIPYSYHVIYNNAQDFTKAILDAILDLDSDDLVKKTKLDVEIFAESFRSADGHYTLNIDAQIICCRK